MNEPSICWIFDELPPSGARRGGQAAEHAFGHGLGAFVREVIQNANDQALGSAQIALELVELEGKALERFFTALRWSTLRGHLAGAGQTPTPSGRRLGEFISELEDTGRLLSLRIEDRGTVGLTGEEDGERSHFRALCKDTLFSIKRSEGAGGSYGLGKSVLWSFSGLSTVLFASWLSSDPKGCQSPRVIGRAELPYHKVEEAGFTGPGWLGRDVEISHGRRRAESVWAEKATKLAETLKLGRPPDAAGTSILVLGFREPTAEQQAKPAQLELQLRSHAAKWFWPAMQVDQRQLEVRIGEEKVRGEIIEAVAPFIDCWRRREQAKTSLESPGDIAKVPVTIDLPRPHDGKNKIRGQVDLLVRLANDDDEFTRRLACFRGAGMVIEYRDLSRVSGLRPFHALLVCGCARSPETPSPADEAIERFLRDAEPPGHDAWLVTPAVRDNWVRGWGQVFPRLWDDIQRALRELLAPVVESGVEGPDRLRKRFPLGRSPTTSNKGPSAFHFSGFQASLSDKVWDFGGLVEPELGARPWRASISLHHCGEDGNSVECLSIAELQVQPDSVVVSLVDGIAEIEAPMGVMSLEFFGTSATVKPELLSVELGLRVFGELKGSS